MRRKNREVVGRDEIEKIIKECKVFRLGVDDGDGIYVLPLNFGYEFKGDDKNTIEFYFHSAKAGKKVELFSKETKVGFEMDTEHSLKEGNIACEYGYKFASVIGKGSVLEITDEKEKKYALNKLMENQTGKSFEFNNKMLNAVNVYKVSTTYYTAKRCK